MSDATKAYFDAGGDDDGYFRCIIPLDSRVPHWPLGTWEQALQHASGWEAGAGRKVHKGSGYYWASVRDMLNGNLDRGFIYMHAGLEDDRIKTGLDLPSTPATRFVTLDETSTDQYFKPEVDRYAAYLKSLLATYSGSGRGTLRFADLRAKALSYPNELLDTFFVLVHTVGRLANLSGPLLGAQLRSTDFAAVLFGGVALDACVVTEHAVKHSPVGGPQATALAPLKNGKKTPTFIHMAVVIAKGAAPPGGVDLTTGDLGTLNSAFQNAYDTTMREVLDGTYTLASGRVLSPREKDVAVAYGIRNVMAHGVPNEPVVAARFNEIEQSLFHCIFSALERLYP